MIRYWLCLVVLAFAQLSSAAARAESADPAIRQAVLRLLALDPLFPTSELEVTVRDGIVTLSGAVSARGRGSRAARTARVVEGVRAVVSRTTVEPVRRSDREIASDVRQLLRRVPAISSLPIVASVKKGVVRLTGSITSWDQQQLAERVAASVPGVRFCQNQLTLARAIRRTPAMVVGDVRSRLLQDPYVARAPIRVSARGSRVLLSGAVASSAQRQRAMQHGWVAGVVAVDASDLQVDAALAGQEGLRRSWPSDAEILTAVGDLAAYFPELPVASLRVAVVGGVVTLAGNVPTLADRDAAVTLARSAVGVVEVRDELRGPWWRAPAPPPAPPPARRKSGARAR